MTRDRLRRPGGWFLAGALLGLLLVAVAIAAVTRTERGREEVLAFTLRALGGRLNGVLEVERVSGNLLSGATLYGVSLRGHDGYPLLVADSAYLNYEVPTFLGGDVILHSVVVHHGDVRLRRLPGDTIWNYQDILADPTPSETPGPPRATLIERLELVDSEVTLHQPWDPDDALEGLDRQARERALRAALSDTARLMVEEVPDGFLRRIEVGVERAEALEVIVSPDERGGTYLRIGGFSGEVRLWRDPPLRVAAAEGELSLREGVVRFRAPVLTLPGSTLAAEGSVDLGGEEPAYDVALAGDAVDLADLRWLYPSIPERGEAAFRLVVETRPEGLLLLARDFSVATPDTRLAGSFGMIAGDTLRFVDVDVEADPLDVSTVERLLPGGLPVEGLRIGGVSIRGSRG